MSDEIKRRCVVATCCDERFNLAHKFPMENDRILQWLNALNIPYLNKIPYDKLRKSYFVCSRHFRSQDYKNPLSRRLNKTAIPCINLRNLDQMDLVASHRTHPRPAHLLNKIIKINNDDDDNDGLTITDELFEDNIKEEILIENNKINLKRSYAKCNEISKNKNIVDNTNDDAANDDDEEDNYIIPEPKKLHYLISCVKDESYSLIIKNNDEEDVEEKEDFDDHYENYEENEIDEDEDNENDGEEEKHSIVKVDENKATEHMIILNDNQIITASAKSTLQHRDNNIKHVVTMTSKFLKVKHPNYSDTLSLDYFWLRDHCRCSLCYNYETNQRKYNLLDISLHIKPQSFELEDDKLLITWDDDHQSEYSVDLLYKSQFDYMKKNLPKQILWDRKRIIDEQYARVDLGKLVTNDSMIEKILKSLITYGIAFIENVPANQDMTEMAIRRLFPIQKTFFGEMWTFNETRNENHSDTAYTKDFLEAHTDNTYFCDAAGLQIFHCLEHINGNGGETFLIDGFKIIQDLMNQNYDAYQKLIEINVPAEYVENDRYHTYSAPIIRLNNDTKKPEQIRFNLYDRSIFNTIPQNEMHEFYEHFFYFSKLIQTKENQWKFKLEPGTVLIFDNWRILHGRESYTGKRTMSGCYVSRTEYLSKARTLGLIR